MYTTLICLISFPQFFYKINLLVMRLVITVNKFNKRMIIIQGERQLKSSLPNVTSLISSPASNGKPPISVSWIRSSSSTMLLINGLLGLMSTHCNAKSTTCFAPRIDLPPKVLSTKLLISFESLAFKENDVFVRMGDYVYK